MEVDGFVEVFDADVNSDSEDDVAINDVQQLRLRKKRARAAALKRRSRARQRIVLGDVLYRDLERLRRRVTRSRNVGHGNYLP